MLVSKHCLRYIYIRMSRLLKWLNYEQEQVSFKEIFLIYTLFISNAFFIFFAFVNYVSDQKLGACILLCGAIVEPFILVLYLKRKLSFTTSVNIGLALGALCLYMDMYVSGGIYSSGIGWVLVFPLLSYYLLEKSRSTRVWIGITIGIILFFGLIQPLSGIVVNGNHISTLDHTLSNIGLVVIITLLTYVFEKKKREKLKESEKQFQTMFEEAPMGITIYNPSKKGSMDVNSRYAEIVGRSIQEIQELGWEKYTHPDDLEEDLNQMAKIKKGEIDGYKLEKRYIRPDGNIVWVNMTITTFKTHIFKGSNSVYMCMIEDITDRKLLEDQQLKANIMLKKNARVLANQNEQLNDFCDIVSHNLRAPLASISMMTDYIENCDDEEERKEMLREIKPVIKNLNEIFNELVESLQVEQDLQVKIEKNNLQEFIDKIVKRFELEIKRTEAEIQCDIVETPFILFPPIYLDSILMNLISNALKYRSPDRKPMIQISTKREADTIQLAFSDNGLGVDTEKHKNNLFKIRKVFHDHPDSKGFGLFITKKQMEVLGGKIEIESELDKGTTFHLEFINQNDESKKVDIN